MKPPIHPSFCPQVFSLSVSVAETRIVYVKFVCLFVYMHAHAPVYTLNFILQDFLAIALLI